MKRKSINQNKSVGSKNKTINPDSPGNSSNACYPVGGQAVIEGVMMKSPHYYSVSVRNNKTKKIITKTTRHISVSEKHRILAWPFVRGCINLFEMLSLGFKTLTYSADLFAEKEEEKLSGTAMFFTIALALVFGIGIFVLLPYFATYFFGFSEDKNSVVFNLVDGLIKIAIFVLYIYLVSFMKDIRRTFQYHGAEHKAVNCYEDGKGLTLQNVKKYTTYHPRCGTSFIMFVFVVMIIVFSVIPSLLSWLFSGIVTLSGFEKRLIYFLTRLLFIIPVAAISYELLKLSYKYRGNWFMKLFLLPGKLLQGITTRKPDKSQTEVAIAALNSVLTKEKSFNNSSGKKKIVRT
jgi:uncharacterized protein YqhQ